MPNLLDIPAELRARIIASTLQFCQPAPADPTDVTDRNDLADIVYLSWCKGDKVMWPKSAACYPPPPTHLELVCKQLRAEVAAYKTRVARAETQNSFHLDLAMVNETLLLPTWRYVPFNNQHRISNFFTTISICGPRGLESRFRAGCRCCGGPAPIAWQFMNVLERVLKVGTQAYRDTVDTFEGFRYKIDNLIINIETPQDLPPELMQSEYGDWPSYDFGTRSDEEKLAATIAKANLVMHPKTLANYMVALELSYIATPRSATLEFGRVLLENVGNVSLLIDGLPHREVDLERMSAKWVGEYQMVRDARLANGFRCAEPEEVAASQPAGLTVADESSGVEDEQQQPQAEEGGKEEVED